MSKKKTYYRRKGTRARYFYEEKSGKSNIERTLRKSFPGHYSEDCLCPSVLAPFPLPWLALCLFLTAVTLFSLGQLNSHSLGLVLNLLPLHVLPSPSPPIAALSNRLIKFTIISRIYTFAGKRPIVPIHRQKIRDLRFCSSRQDPRRHSLQKA